ELRQLRYFAAVAREGHFRSAAAALGLAPPSLSVQVQLLERELHVRLFDRNRHRVSLTFEGQTFLPLANKILDDVESARTVMNELARRGETGSVRIGVPMTL